MILNVEIFFEDVSTNIILIMMYDIKANFD